MQEDTVLKVHQIAAVVAPRRIPVGMAAEAGSGVTGQLLGRIEDGRGLVQRIAELHPDGVGHLEAGPD